MIVAFQESRVKLKVSSLLNGLIISRSEISTDIEIVKMQLLNSLVLLLCILRLTYATINSCEEETMKNVICFKSTNGSNAEYDPPFPLDLNSTMMLKEIIEINENENSITVRVDLVTRWRDPGIGLSNKTNG